MTATFFVFILFLAAFSVFLHLLVNHLYLGRSATARVVFGISVMVAFLAAMGLAHSAELTKPVTLAWEQSEGDFTIATGQTKPPLANWKLHQRNTPGGAIQAVVTVPIVQAQLGPAVGGYRTYTYGPFNVTATGTGNTTVQRCWVVSAVGNDTPPTETTFSNEVCMDFVLPADPVRPPGVPTRLRNAGP